MGKLKILLMLLFVLGESPGASAWTFKDFALFSQPQKVSHENSIILGNGQFHNVWVSHGRPFLEKEREKSLIQSPEDKFNVMKKAYKNVGPLHDNIYFFDEKQILNGKADRQFWSYVNSPTRKGGLAYRPLLKDDNFKSWPDYRKEYENKPPWRLYSTNGQNEMSAASKYDYLFGDNNLIFKQQVLYANRIYSRHGKIAHWAGICHGTAPASFSYPEPLNGVTVKAHDNKEIHFTPEDIKRLAAHIWGENYISYVQVGSRCRLNRLGSRESACLDTNPATFHLALLNYMGLYQKTFIMDNAYDSLVWNRPVMSFKYKYKNPLTKVPSEQLKYSLIKIEDYDSDPFSQYRAEDARYIVGVQMTVKLLYGDESAASHNSNPGYNIKYSYDLEIDESGKIIGGEWETLYHPDFLWMVVEGRSPKASEDFLIKEKLWNGRARLSSHIRKLGQNAAGRGELLEHVVRSLVHLSKSEASSKGVYNDHDLQ